MTGDDGLFDATPYRLTPEDPVPVSKLSADRRRTQLQGERIAGGVHPLSGSLGYPLRLHPDAPRTTDLSAPGPRCGSCRFRELMSYHTRSYPKCTYRADNVKGFPRITNGAGSDVRKRWPACVDYTPGDPGLSPDAARSIPGYADA